jgi:bacterioferritin
VPTGLRLLARESGGTPVRGEPSVIEILNDVLTAELTAINQYFVDAKMCANWGYERLASRLRAASMGEMRDAEELVERILYLDGIPNLQRLGAVRVGETVREKLDLALDVESTAIERLGRGIAACHAAPDHGSRALLERVLHGEEEHADWIETQLTLIDQAGEALYLAQQIRD